jgi:hypothetical protein
MVAYGKSMSIWPVPCEPIDVTGSYGRTHLKVSGPPDARLFPGPWLVLQLGHVVTEAGT